MGRRKTKPDPEQPQAGSLAASETLDVCAACGEMQPLESFRVGDGAGGEALATRCAACREAARPEAADVDWSSIPPKHQRLLKALFSGKGQSFRSAAIEAGMPANTSQAELLRKYPQTAKVYQQLLVASGLTLDRLAEMQAQNARAVKPFYDPASDRTTFVPDFGVRHRVSELALKAWDAMPQEAAAGASGKVVVLVTNLFAPPEKSIEGVQATGALVAEVPRVLEVEKVPDAAPEPAR